ncbi:class I adenylate-forming enzyme family protein [Microbacterium sp. Mu-80]|uniref:Class I adenylate-forming enzyme family protein n=1 Tax=Microbacterium bandirmense TaxID=3122050 RepID=A0ABU8LBQ3_9MICO
MNVPALDPATAADYVAQGWWGELTIADYVARNAETIPERIAYVADGARLTWREYDRQVDVLACALAALLPRGARFGMLLPDSGEFHVALCAAERSGTVAVGMGARSGRDEIRHLMSQSGAEVLVMRESHRDRPALDYVADLRADGWLVSELVIVDPRGPVRMHRFADGVVSTHDVPSVPIEETRSRAAGPNELSMLNSTSGTTGRPKLVTQFANRLIAFSKMAFEAADFTPDDVMMGAVPGPFGFGLWTAHYATAMLGMKTVLMERFDVDEMIRLIGEEEATILACVSTQFKMMLDTPSLEGASLDTLRAMFTGGEAVPYERALQFEERVGAKVLQFYGSNESGAISNTSLRDTAEQRLRTAGRVIDVMNMRLYDAEGNDITETGGPGRPGVSGPTICMGYYGDPAANEELFHDGRLMMPDLVTVDADGYLRVVGRTSDLIIRGGKNISAIEVEELVEAHPGVVMASAVPVPDELFGERIGVAVTVHDAPVTVAELTAYLADRGISKHLYPERVVVVDELPRAAGGKVAKGAVRALVAAQAQEDVDLRESVSA